MSEQQTGFEPGSPAQQAFDELPPDAQARVLKYIHNRRVPSPRWEPKPPISAAYVAVLVLTVMIGFGVGFWFGCWLALNA